MDAILGILELIGVFVAGLVARLGLVLVVLAALALPFALWAGVRRGWQWTRRRVAGLEPAGKLVFVPALRYAPGHTWVREDGKRLTVGIDDLAQKILPWAVSVRLPQPGAHVRAGATAAVISCGDREARIASPVDGTVTAVNGAVAHDPALVKKEAYQRGWLFAVEPSDGGWRQLPTGDAAREWLRHEEERLERRLELQLGVAAADGGEWVAPPHTFLSRDEWQSVARSILSPGPNPARS